MIGAHSGNSAPSSDTDIILCHSLPCKLGRGACHSSLPSECKACNSCLSLLFASTASCHWFLSLYCLQYCLQMRPSAAGFQKRCHTIDPDYAAVSQPAVAACRCSLSLLPLTAACHCCLPLLAVSAACHCYLSLQHVTVACHCCLSLLPVTAAWCCCQCTAIKLFCHCLQIGWLSLPASCHRLRWLLPTTVPSRWWQQVFVSLLKIAPPLSPGYTVRYNHVSTQKIW